MNGLALFAFVIMPMMVVTMGYIAVLLHEAAARRLDEAEGRSKPRKPAAVSANDENTSSRQRPYGITGG